MAKLTFKMRVFELRGKIETRDGITTGTGTYEFSHDLIHLKAGTFSGGQINFDDAKWGDSLTTKSYENQLAAWKTLSLAIQGTRSLMFAMPVRPDIENYYRKHTTLAEKLGNVTLLAFNNFYDRSREWNSPPDESIGIFDVTVNPNISTAAGMTWVSMYYSGATKEWF